MAVTSKQESQALSHAHANAALDEALALLHTDKEALRAANWNRRSQAARHIAVAAARLPKERAGDALKQFNALERGQICLAVRRLMKELEIITLAMQGGAFPDTTGGDRTHQFDGIASIGTVQ